MKFRLITLAAILIAAAVPMLQGCSGKKAAEAELKELTPDMVVDKVINGIQSKKLENLEFCFSSELDAKKVKSFLAEKSEKIEISKFRIGPPGSPQKADQKSKIKRYTIEKNLAYVPLKYSFREKVVDKKGTERPGKAQVIDTTVVLVEEKGIWKIRKFEPDFDKMFEAGFFDNCRKSLEFAKVAEEKYLNANGKFTADNNDLKTYVTDLNLNTCATFEISRIEKDSTGRLDYTMRATTRNIPSCTILADRDSTRPEKFDNCPK